MSGLRAETVNLSRGERLMPTKTAHTGHVQVSLGDGFQVIYTCVCGDRMILHQNRRSAECSGCGQRFGFRVMVGRLKAKKQS